MTAPSTPDTLGARLAKLRPVAHALNDPYFQVAFRPIDASWYHAGIVSSSGGFNPARHTYYAARQSLLAEWIAAPSAFRCPEDRQLELALEAQMFAHDYMHGWAYRLFAALYPPFRVGTPETVAQLEEQAFFMIVSETVATVGTDYWYFSKAGTRQRCGTSFDLGPLTIAYYEKYLPIYRRADPDLTVRAPEFFDRIFRLYGSGEFYGFSQDDLEDSKILANWMNGELRISTHQRNLSLNWLAYLGGMEIDSSIRARKFRELSERHAELVTEVGHRLWQKIRYGRHDFVPTNQAQGQWQIGHDDALDCRFANLNYVGARKIETQANDQKCWHSYVDQTLAGRCLPDDRTRRKEIAESVSAIRQARDIESLTALAESLGAVDGDDPAPLELLFLY